MFKPTQFGKYFLTERIAVGGMAELFKATLFGISGFEKPMVVKQILPRYSKNEEFIRMFVDEAKIAVSLTHGNIVPIYELGRVEDVYFIAMEYVHGRDLAEILEQARARSRPISPEHAAYITIEICKGLEYAHRRTDADGRPLRVVHRDISPPNILISFDGEVKIADFGIAKAAHKLGSTEAGVVKGTFGYMSPEQVRGLPLDHRTDIFSAGILLHEMLTGRRLFTGDSEVEAIERVKVARIPAPSALNPRVPAAIDPIVFKALAREPSDRFADANEFQLALSRFLFTAGKGATASTLSSYLRDLFAEELRQEQARERESRPSPRPPPASGFVAEEPTLPEAARAARRVRSRPRQEDSQIFAVRPELDQATRPSRAMDVGGGVAPAIGATLALPSLATDPGPPLLLERRDEDEERTHVFQGGPRVPPRPEVPELRFPPRGDSRPSASAVPFPSPSGLQPAVDGDEFPSGEELAALADQLSEQPRSSRSPKSGSGPGGNPASGPLAPSSGARPTGPVGPASRPSGAPRGALQRPAGPAAPMSASDPSPGESELPAAPPRAAQAASAAARQTGSRRDSDSALIKLLAEPSGSQPAVDDCSQRAPAQGSVSPAPAAQARAPAPRRPAARPVGPSPSGLLSATMRLFIDGLDQGGARAGSASFPAESGPLPVAETGRQSSLTGSLEVPRTIKPTTLGWMLIGLVVVGAGLFVLYKKTDLFARLFGRSSSDEGGELLKAEDIRKGELTRPAVKGSITLSSTTPGASFFLFSGETPSTLSLELGKSHVLRVERDGFQTVHRVIQPDELAAGRTTELQVSLQPAGAGAKDEPFEFKESGRGEGRKAAVRVTSNPPVAMVWLLGGRERLEMRELDTSKTFNFKVVAPGYQPLLVNVAPADFDKTTGSYASAVTLEKEGAGPGVAPSEHSKGEDSKDEKDERQGAEPEAGAGSERGPEAAPPPKPKARPKLVRPRPRPPSKVLAAPKKKASPAKANPQPASKTKIHTPDWAK